MSGTADGSGSGGRARDAVLAAIPLAITVGALATGRAAVVPAALAAGCVLAVLLEWVATRHRATVREGWEHPPVQIGATAGAVLVVAAAAVGQPGSAVAGWVVSTAVGGLVTYLALLGTVAVRDAVD